MELNYEVEFGLSNTELYYKEVVFSGEPRWENDGIGDYEFWGNKKTDYGHNYVSMEGSGDATWDKTLYSEEENEIIKVILTNVMDDMCKAYQKESIEEIELP